MLKKYIFILICTLPCFGEWVMFSDTKDTYLYNNQTGEVYVRYQKQGKNYEDVFVKMPRGMLPQELNQTTPPPPPPIQAPQEDPQLQSLQKAEKMMNEALEGNF